MYSKCDFRFSTLIGFCRRRRHQYHYHNYNQLSTCSWLVMDGYNTVRYLTTMNPVMIEPYRAQIVVTPFRQPYYSSELGRPRLQSLCQYFSYNATETKEKIHWNTRVTEFLDSSFVSAANSDPVLKEDYPFPQVITTAKENKDEYLSLKQLRSDEAAETVQILLNDLLQITAVIMQRGEYADSSVVLQEKGFYHNNQYTNSETELPSLQSSSSPSLEGNMFDYQTNVEIYKKESVDIGLAFALLDRLVALEQTNNSSHINHTLQWMAHTSCLNPILQLWKQKYSPSTKSKLQSNPVTSTKMSHSGTSFNAHAYAALLTPSQVLAKLDAYREHSCLLIPDVQSYNIILDAVATHSNTICKVKVRLRATEGHRRNKGKNVVDIDFCRSLCEWMWQESKQDSLVRPDKVTLRTMLKANVLTGHELAPQRCEALVEEWGKYENRNNSNIYNEQEECQTINDPNGTLLLSLVHVWALHDPYVAESYLKELSRRYISGKSYDPPDTIAWNRVVSAYAIVHNQPERAHQVLEDFWEFYQNVHGLVDGTLNNNKGYAATNNDGNGIVSDVNAPSSKYNSIWKVSHPNLHTYNAVLEGYARQENAHEANKVLSRLQMVASTSPNIVTYTSAIKANRRDLPRVQELADQCITVYNAQEQTNNDDQESARHLILDRAFFHAWLNACAKAENIVEAKNVIKQMKTFNLKPNATTYRMLIEVFLSRNDSQEAIEWILAYAKLEDMSESAIASCTIHLLNWYRNKNSNGKLRNSGDVDSLVLLELLCENNFLTQEESLQQLLLGISANQGKAVLGWLRRKNRTSLKIWAIVLRALAQEGSQAQVVEDLFLQLQDELPLKEKFDEDRLSAFNDEEAKLFAEIYGSIIVAWSKQKNLVRIKYWTEKLDRFPDGSLPLNLAAQIAIVTMYCQAKEPAKAEKYMNELERAYEEGRIVAPPDTIMCNMILNAWAQSNNGERAAAFFGQKIKEPDAVSYNTVINAFARQGRLERAEQWAYDLVASFCENPVESRRPQQATFTVLLAAWRRSRNPNAAERAEKVLTQMHQLYDKGILLQKPNFKSYQTVLDTYEKSSHRNAAQKSEQFLSSSADFRDNKKLRSKVRKMKSRERKIKESTSKDTAKTSIQ